ncbi:hypothetical protein [Paenibacillus sp. SYP-B4298]|uniref:hypothetical protein n=1 Tax=Paenibacillus sp. SYP-B4298 TaxID=2996034 RepID=UPI0022DE8E45|nr:hypothetical protein [Paenibacillus sp. SYP-B4298]
METVSVWSSKKAAARAQMPAPELFRCSCAQAAASSSYRKRSMSGADRVYSMEQEPS